MNTPAIPLDIVVRVRACLDAIGQTPFDAPIPLEVRRELAWCRGAFGTYVDAVTTRINLEITPK